tara:strand:+ start:460 stop:804 length:345 start_codon:yes stop_codon:yes gene_type:complete
MIPNFIVNKLIINFKKYIFFSIIFLLIFNQVKSDEIYNKGKKIFIEQGACATCHAHSDSGSDGNIGPDLDFIKPDINRVIAVVTNGVGVMPAYQDILSSEEIEAVAHYVSISTE